MSANERSRDSAPTGIGRRDLLVQAGLLAASAGVAATVAVAAEEHHHGHEHGEGHKYFKAERYARRAELVAASNDCIAKGQACISHCMETFLSGDTTMAECAFAVQQMLPVCNAMSYLAAYDSAQLKSMARACIEVCKACEDACRPHQQHQPECRACADACAALIAEAGKVA